MSAQKTERLLNLVICLLSTRQFLAKEQIRTAVPQYVECPSDEAFDRMFERDKEELRDMGIPLETGGNDAWFDDEVGYRVDRAAYALPEVALHARRAGRPRPGLPGLAAGQPGRRRRPGPLLKLKAAGVEPDLGSLVGIEPRVRTSEPAFEPVYAAVRDRRPIRFPYRTPGRPTVTERHLEPWGIVSRHGRWYVVGHDRDRDATRVFRLSRVAGPVRSRRPRRRGAGARGHRPPGPGRHPGADPRRPARPGCASAPGSGVRLRRRATAQSARAGRLGRAAPCPTATSTCWPRRSPATAPTSGWWTRRSCGTPSYAGCAACWASPAVTGDAA